MTLNQLIAAAQALYAMDDVARSKASRATAAKYLSAEALEFHRAHKAGENPSRPPIKLLLTPAGQELVGRIGSNAVRLILASPQLRQLGDRMIALTTELLKAPPAAAPVVAPAANLAYVPKVLCA